MLKISSSPIASNISVDDSLLGYTASTVQEALEEIGTGGGGAATTNKVQTKYLTADATADVALSDLEFNGLTTNNYYQLTGQVSFYLDDGIADYRLYLTILNSGTAVSLPYIRCNETADTRVDVYNFSVSAIFKATGPQITMTPGFATVSSSIRGNGTKSETFFTLTERNDLVETTDFT